MVLLLLVWHIFLMCLQVSSLVNNADTTLETLNVQAWRDQNMPHKQQQNHFLVEVLQYMWNRCMSRGKKTQTVYTRCGYWYYLKTTNTVSSLVNNADTTLETLNVQAWRDQ
jgi:hypothetical protein